MITIAICTKNRALILKKCLEILSVSLKFSPKKTEIIVIDSSTNRDAEKILKSINIPINYIHNNENLSSNRNLALKIVKGNVVVFLDDDTFVSKNWLSEIGTSLKKFPRAALIGGKVLLSGSIPKNLKYIYSLKEGKTIWSLGLLDFGNKTKILSRGSSLGTAGLIIRKKFLNVSGAFDESLAKQTGFLKIFGGEDYEFVRRALEKKCQVVYYPKLLLIHQIFPYKLKKNYFRWRYFEHGKEEANINRLHYGPNKMILELLKLLFAIPVNCKRTISEYLLERPQNFRYEVHMFYSVGYLLATIVFLVQDLLIKGHFLTKRK